MLGELGRIGKQLGPNAMRDVALRLCRKQPTTKDGQRWLRAERKKLYAELLNQSSERLAKDAAAMFLDSTSRTETQ